MFKIFGKYLKTIRNNRGFTQRDLAEKVGVDYTYISKVENEVVDAPSVATIIKMAKILSINTDVLLLKAGRIPEDISNYLVENKVIIDFLRVAQEKNLNNNHWALLTEFLKEF